MKRKRPPQVIWREVSPLPHGSRQWESTDGLFRFQCIDRYDDIPMKPKYNLYVFNQGKWKRLLENFRSRTSLMKYARARKEAIENSEDEE